MKRFLSVFFFIFFALSGMEFFDPITSRDSQKVAEVIKKGGNVNDFITLNDKPLHYASRIGEVNIVKMLIDAGADVNAQTQTDKITPLHDAARNGNLTVVIILCNAGGKVNLQDENGETPLHMAAQYGHKAIAEECVRREADCSLRNKKGQTAYDLAKNAGHTDIAAYLQPMTKKLRRKKFRADRKNGSSKNNGINGSYSN